MDVAIREARPDDAAGVLAHSRGVMSEPDTFTFTRLEELRARRGAVAVEPGPAEVDEEMKARLRALGYL